MRAFALPEFNATGSVIELPVPEAGDGQILVRVEAAGVNPMDSVAAGGYMAQMVEHRTPLVPGFDYAGVVQAVGPGVSGVAVGDRVFGALGKGVFGEGSWAEYTTAASALARPIPDGLTAIDAAALPLAGGEALALADAVGAGPGTTIAVIGAAGGVGSFATQLLSAAGASVIAVTRPDNADHVRTLGATEVVDSGADVAAELRRIRPDGVDAIIDLYHDVPQLRELAAAVRDGGLVVSPRAMGIEEAFADSNVRGALVSAALDRVGELADGAARGDIVVHVRAVPLADAGEALKAIGSAGVRGKLVVTISG